MCQFTADVLQSLIYYIGDFSDELFDCFNDRYSHGIAVERPVCQKMTVAILQAELTIKEIQ